MSQPILQVKGLRKVYPSAHGEFVAVDNVNFDLARGGSVGIVGESGSGKTTTARMLIGLERPTAGQIMIDGADHSRPAGPSREWRRRGRRIQIVFQDPYTSLDPTMPVAACLAEVIGLHFDLDRAAVTARVLELADMVGLDDRQLAARPSALSGGQRQRVAIARALAAEPKVLILDKAVSALDVSIQAQILNLLADIREETGISYLFISHDLAVIRQICDRCLVMRKGMVVESGDTATLLDNPQHSYTRLLRDSVPRPGWEPKEFLPYAVSGEPE